MIVGQQDLVVSDTASITFAETVPDATLVQEAFVKGGWGVMGGPMGASGGCHRESLLIGGPAGSGCL